MSSCLKQNKEGSTKLMVNLSLREREERVENNCLDDCFSPFIDFLANKHDSGRDYAENLEIASCK